MIPDRRHIHIFTLVLLVLFVLANSGFTLVLYHCTMAENNPGMQCCATEGNAPGTGCGDVNSPASGNTLSLYGDGPCRVMSVAGGLRVDPTVLEKHLGDWHPTQVVLLGECFLDAAPVSPLDSFSADSAAEDANAGTSAVETYVLNSTFLI
jgi:hypothetical protein